MIGKVSFDDTPVISRTPSKDLKGSSSGLFLFSKSESVVGSSRRTLSRSSSGQSLASADIEVAEQLAAVVKVLSPRTTRRA